MASEVGPWLSADLIGQLVLAGILGLVTWVIRDLKQTMRDSRGHAETLATLVDAIGEMRRDLRELRAHIWGHGGGGA